MADGGDAIRHSSFVFSSSVSWIIPRQKKPRRSGFLTNEVTSSSSFWPSAFGRRLSAHLSWHPWRGFFCLSVSDSWLQLLSLLLLSSAGLLSFGLLLGFFLGLFFGLGLLCLLLSGFVAAAFSSLLIGLAASFGGSFLASLQELPWRQPERLLGRRLAASAFGASFLPASAFRGFLGASGWRFGSSFLPASAFGLLSWRRCPNRSWSGRTWRSCPSCRGNSCRRCRPPFSGRQPT